VLVCGIAYVRIADNGCSVIRTRTRRDESVTAGIFTELKQNLSEVYDKMIGLELATLIVDGCILKDPCGGEAAGRSPCRSQKTG